MILAMGLIGMVLMSLMMKHLVEVKSDYNRSPYAAAVEARLGSRRLGPVRIEEEISDGRVHLTVRTKVIAGRNKKRLAESVGLELWLGILRAGTKVETVSVVMDDEDGGDPVSFAIAPPSMRR
jgi:hypothetical protein